MEPAAPYFDHEKLKVYRTAIEFVAWLAERNVTAAASGPLRDQLIRASTSVALNIAEGNGKRTPRDRCRYFDISRGSALECAACLDILAVQRLIDLETLNDGKSRLRETVNMLVGLVRAVESRDAREVREERLPYGEASEQEQD